MRKAVLLLPVAVAVSACAVGPTAYTALTPKPIPDTFTCAMAQVNQLGYTVANASKDGGIIVGERRSSGLGTALLTGAKTTDQIHIAIFDASGSAGGNATMRVTAGSSSQQILMGAGSKDDMREASAKGKADAAAIMAACAPGSPVTEVNQEQPKP